MIGIRMASDIKLLRDEMAKLVAENKKKDTVIDKLISIIEAQKAQIVGQSLEINRLRSFYENPHTPPSHNSIPTRQKKAAARKDEKAGAKPGRMPGHVGVSHRRRSERRIHHRPDRCGSCGGGNVHETRSTTKQVVDIKEMPEVVVTSHVSHYVECADCGGTTSPNTPSIPETSLGPSLLSLIVQMWERPVSLEGIRETIKTFGINVCKATIQHAVDAASKKMEDTAGRLRGSIGDSRYIKMDDISYTIYDRQGYVWACIGDNAVNVVVAGSRSQGVMEQHFPYTDKPITCDGYSGYSLFATKQRCWAHILREAGHRVPKGPEYRMLHRRLQELYYHAKKLPPDISDDEYRGLVCSARAIAGEYKKMGDKFGVTLDNAADCLFTFVRHEGMEPTNNESERMLRRPVIHRKVRMRLVTEGGMRMFGILHTCLLSWRKQGADVHKMLLDVLGAT